MKTLKILFLISVLLIVAVYGWNNLWVSEQTHQVSGFNSIYASGSLKVFLEKGDKESVQIRTDNRIHDKIDVFVENGQLKVYTNQKISMERVLNVYVTYKVLDSLKVGGAVRLRSNDELVSRNLKITVSAAADVRLQVDSDNLDLTMKGSANVLLAGNAERFNFSIHDFGDLVAYNLNSKVCQAIVNTGDQSPGVARISVSDSLSVFIKGPRYLYYKGDPIIVSREIIGEGRLQKK
jgi:Putative auto-transporter adhesin, head GIN domain